MAYDNFEQSSDQRTSGALSARYYTSVQTAGEAAWNRLLPGKGEDWAYLAALETVPPPGFKLGAMLTERAGALAAVAPVFRTSYRFDTSFQGRLRQATDRLYRAVPKAVSMDMLSLGSPLADASLIGFAPELDTAARADALNRMLQSLEDEARREGVPLVAAKGLDDAEAAIFDHLFAQRGYRRVTTLPNVVLDLPFASVEEYLASLQEGTARYLKRKWRSASKIRIEYRTSIGDVQHRVNELYRATLAQSRWDYGAFGPLHPDYFETVLREQKDRARLMLCWSGDELLSFQLFLAGQDAVPAKGIGMSYPKAREHNLYFINWKEMIEFCIARGIPRISMAGTTYATKLMMGGRLCRQHVYFRFTSDLLNRLLPHLAPMFDFEANDPELRGLPSDLLDRAAERAALQAAS
jgi:predicted N-acyltransferase